jgi:DNA-binding response OmpR family regulator
MTRLLLIETHAPLVRLMSWFLLDAGFEVVRADGVDSALTLIRAGDSIVVFNSGMPDEDKLAAISSLREASPGSRFLDVSGVVRPPTRQLAGADASLNIPFDADSLIAHVRELEGHVTCANSRGVQYGDRRRVEGECDQADAQAGAGRARARRVR